jgi:hypothetical protein
VKRVRRSGKSVSSVRVLKAISEESQGNSSARLTEREISQIIQETRAQRKSKRCS